MKLVSPRHFIVSIFIAGLLVHTSSGALIFTEIMYDSTATDIEWVEIYNSGTAVDLLGWRIDDVDGGGSAPQVVTSSSFNFGMGSTLVIGSETLADFNARWSLDFTSAEYIGVSSFPGLNNSGGDAVRLIDSFSVEQSSVAYLESAPWPGNAVGNSIALTLNPTAATLSEINNGAHWMQSSLDDGRSFQASNGDIGSPGAAVPEPASFALLFVGLVALARFWKFERRHR